MMCLCLQVSCEVSLAIGDLVFLALFPEPESAAADPRISFNPSVFKEVYFIFGWTNETVHLLGEKMKYTSLIPNSQTSAAHPV